jgi:glutaredoxin 3
MAASTKDIVIYESALCGFCSAAKRLLDKKQVEYRTIRVDLDADQKQKMMELSGRRTVPQIFIDDHHVGGFDDLAELDSTGELDGLLS